MAKSDGLSVGNRMKRYESVCAWTMPRRVPVILRIDGRAFHTVTRKRFDKGWCMEFVDQMIETAKTVKKDIQGCEFCYCQSDEISFLITDYRKISTEAWFGYDARKMISISASLASSIFSRLYGENVCFDSRVFSVPQDEVVNYFVWRQIDATRNAIQMAGRENFSHKQMFKKSCSDIQEMLFQKGINFDKYPVIRKRGFCIVDRLVYENDRDNVDMQIPIFSKDRNYIEKYVYIRED
jgi:tRNA(His) 5'-end guanylyltransferase